MQWSKEQNGEPRNKHMHIKRLILMKKPRREDRESIVSSKTVMKKLDSQLQENEIGILS